MVPQRLRMCYPLQYDVTGWDETGAGQPTQDLAWFSTLAAITSVTITVDLKDHPICAAPSTFTGGYSQAP